MIIRLSTAAALAAFAVACSSTPEPAPEEVVTYTTVEEPVVLAAPTLPGTSRTDDALAQRVLADLTSRSAAAFASDTGMECNANAISLVDRNVTTNPVYDNAPWTETWLMDACREDMAFRVDFFPNDSGPTQYRASLMPKK